MVNISIKYSWEQFGNSIEVFELWNSLIWFWALVQTVAQISSWIKKIDIKVTATEPGSFITNFDIGLLWATTASLIASNPKETIDVIIWTIKKIIDMKKFLKWKEHTGIESVWDGNVIIKDCEWNQMTINYNIVQNYYWNEKIDKQLWQTFSPLQNIPDLQQVDIGVVWEEEQIIANISKEDAIYFKKDVLKDVIKDREIIWIITEMNTNTNWWQIEVWWKQIFVDYKAIFRNEDKFNVMVESLRTKVAIKIKADAEYNQDWSLKKLYATDIINETLLEASK